MYRKNRDIEIELLFPVWKGQFPDDFIILDGNYLLEDRREQEIGIVVSTDAPITGDANEAIRNFLHPIIRKANEIALNNPVLRVVVFNRAVTLSIRIDCLPLLVQFGVELDLIVYPTSEDDETS